MVRARAFLFALLLALPARAGSAAAGPDANLLFQLEKQNRNNPWLRVTTDSGRFRLKADRLDPRGLSGFRAHHEEPLPRDPLAWKEIQRLDQIHTRGRAFGFTGALVMCLVGAGLGAVAAPSGSGDAGNYAWAGLLAGGAAGAWLGSSYGDRFQKDVNWYAAALPAPSAPPPTNSMSIAAALADTGRADSASAIASVPAVVDTVAEPPATPEALSFASRIGPSDLMRVSGEFHAFQGYAHIAGPLGLEHIVVDRDAPGEWLPHDLPKRVPWHTIDQVQMKASNVWRGALIGGLSLGALGALAAAAYVAAWQDPGVGSGAAVGGAVAGGIGLVLGAGIGSMSHHWAVVYPHP